MEIMDILKLVTSSISFLVSVIAFFYTEGIRRQYKKDMEVLNHIKENKKERK